MANANVANMSEDESPGHSSPAIDFCRGLHSREFLIRDNFHHRRDIERTYIGTIKRAQYEVMIASAYFLPGFDLRHSLIRAARRGVKVILLLQGQVEYLLAHHSARALYGKLLDAGVQIYEYQGGLSACESRRYRPPLGDGRFFELGPF
jgi:cardiolipin synthase